MKFLTEHDPHKKRFCSIDPITMAIGGGALAGMGGNIFSSIMGSKASKKQAEMMKYAADRGKEIATESRERAWSEFNEKSNRFLQPYHSRGNQSGKALFDFLMSGGNTLGGRNIEDLLQESSLFKFERDIGTRDINRQLKARGLYGSGAGIEALSRFENELVAKEGQRFVDRTMSGLTELSRQGLQAGMTAVGGAASLGGSTMALGGQTANLVTQAHMAAGQSTGDAGRSLAQLGPGIAGPLANFGGSMVQYDLYKPMINSMAGGGGGNLTSNQLSEEAKGLAIVHGTQRGLGVFS
jgi:hypothetical protein